MSAQTSLSDAARTVAHPVASPTAPLQCLRMAVGTATLAVPISAVREILEYGRLTPLPRTPAFVRGVMNLRGAVVPVIDLALRLGQPATEIGRRSCIVVVEVAGDAATETDDTEAAEIGEWLIVGLLVDSVYSVFDADAATPEPVPPLGTVVAAELLDGIVRTQGQPVPLLGLARALSPRGLAQAIGGAVH